MNLIDLCADLSTKLLPTDISTVELPLELLGAFRRKSISFLMVKRMKKPSFIGFNPNLLPLI